MTYDARQVANWFVARAQQDGRILSIMSLLKLTYIAHGWHLELRDSPLFSNEVEAWRYGPVIPAVYNDFRSQGVNVRNPVGTVSPATFKPEDASLLDQVWQIYGNLSPFQLSALTHVPGGPWDIATKMGGYYAPMPIELIQQHYKLLRANAAGATGAANG